MRILNNISAKEMFSMVAMVIAGAICLIVPLSAIYMNNKAINESMAEQKKEVYMYENNAIKKAKLVEHFRDPEEGSIKGHLILFHNLFWSSEPYMEYIRKNYNQAKEMGDSTIQTLYTFLERQEHYFEKNVAGGYSILVEIDKDDIEIDFTTKPYEFRVTAQLKVIRNQDIMIKKLVTTGKVRNNLDFEEKQRDKKDSYYTAWQIVDYEVLEMAVIKNLKQNDL
ncbi:hypothetical protein [Aquimarina mytili]|uniref:Conjugative transposon protein TraK n=1 Tax=Aquimarina mytili TaxID=874423 RepID=A0A936ZUY8_9FLAO|nr:hypothetical protein [Aquimarina mytili]MBL0686069.1 hypothetical protein [Aquimarina mytili]